MHDPTIPSPWPSSPGPADHQPLEQQAGQDTGQPIYQGDALTVRHLPVPAAQPLDPAAAVAGWSSGTPGASAEAEYRRRRRLELAGWWRGAPWRLAVVIAGGFAGYALGSALLLPRPGWLLALGAGASGWLVRFRASQPTRAWRDGARGERATARRLRRLERDGYTILHNLAVPGSRANIDHLVIGPSGVFVIDSKRYRGHVTQSPDGMVWHGRYPLAQTLATVWWEASQVAEALQAGPQVPVTPVLVVHRAQVAWGGLLCAGVPVIPPGVLLQVLTAEAVLPAELVGQLTQHATARLRQAA